MNKNWDKVVIPTSTWKECLRVLKPGAFAFIMSSPRQDVLSRMIVNLQDAGFETGFSSIYWTYACLSEDTEVFTKDGWERYRNTIAFKGKEILVYSISNDEYHFESPTKWEEYNQIKDTVYRIKSDYTDQIVTRNHRCLVESEGRILFQFAETLEQKISVPYLGALPTLQESISNVSFYDKKKGQRSHGNILFGKLQTEGKYLERSSSKRQTYSQNVRSTETETTRSNDGRKESCLERWRNIFQNKGKLCWRKIHSLPHGVQIHGKEGWLCNGTQNISSHGDRQAIIKNGSGSSYGSRSNQQQSQQSYVICEQPTSQEIRTFPKSYKTTLATVSREYYEGLVFCPTVSTGCFVARRNGKIFLTGNSGFPKAASISKLADKRNGKTYNPEFREYINQKRAEKGLTFKDINEYLGYSIKGGNFASDLLGDKLNHRFLLPSLEIYKKLKTLFGLDNRFDELIEREEAEREIIGRYKAPDGKERSGSTWYKIGRREDHRLTVSATEQAKALDGAYCGAQFKPALEICLVCMRPLSEKSYVDQALANRKGITWLDDCRIPYQNEDDAISSGYSESEQSGLHTWNQLKVQQGDRKPTVLKKSDILFKFSPDQKGRFPANVCISDSILGNDFSRFFSLDKWFETTFPFIITPKPSKRERNMGLIDSYFEPKKVNDGRQTPIDNPFQRGETPRFNSHPTIKPIKLCSYLIMLGSREGDTILDPFCGSGTTMIAADMLNRKGIGIEISSEYAAIAQARLVNIKQPIQL